MPFNYTHETAIWSAFGEYRTVPLRGKRPLPEAWTEISAGMPIEAMRGFGKDWSINDVTGYGILLGTPAGDGTYLVAIDIDLDDYDDILELRGALPASPMMKKGKKGLTLFYRTSAELARPRVYKGMLDFLGTGRQTVMPGSLHPETGKVYAWVEGTGPVPPHALPVLTEDNIVEMEEMLASLGWDRRYADNSSRHVLRAVAADGDRVEGSIMWLNRQALDNIPSWVEDLALFNGEWRGARYTCVNTMRASSTGRPNVKRKRNLSIHPTGIKDFGTGETYSPIDLVMGHTGFSQEEAYEFLAERCDPNWSAKQDIGALIKNAELKQATKKALKTVEERAEEAQKEVEDEEIDFRGKVNRAMGPLPVSAFEKAPGFIGRCAREMLRHNPLMPKTTALLSAISTVSALAARRYVGETRGGTLQLTTYTCAMAGTGSGKDAALKFGGNLIQACVELGDERCRINNYGKPYDRLASKKERGGATMPSPGTEINAMAKLIVAADLTGDAALFGMLWQTACPWLRVDEFGSVFAGMASRKKHAGTPVTAILRSLYSYTPSLKGKAYAINQTVGDELQALRDAEMRFPAITLFGVTTPEQMYDALDDGMIEDGTINRFLIAHEDPEPSSFDDTLHDLFGDRGDNRVAEHIAQEAIEIFARDARFGNGTGAYDFLGYVNDMDDRMDVFVRPQLIIVPSESDEIRRSMAAYVHAIHEERRGCEEEGPVGNTIIRVGENFLRLCYLAAIADSAGEELVVRERHVAWAKDVMDAVKRNLISLVSDHMGSRQLKQKTRMQLRILRRADKIAEMNLKGEAVNADTKLRGQWLPLKGIMNAFNSGERDAVQEAMRGLEEMGDVITRNIQPDGTEHKNGLKCCLFTHLVNK